MNVDAAAVGLDICVVCANCEPVAARTMTTQAKDKIKAEMVPQPEIVAAGDGGAAMAGDIAHAGECGTKNFGDVDAAGVY